MGDVVAEGHLGHGVHRQVSRTAALDLERTDFGLFQCMFGRDPWEAVLKGQWVPGRLDVLQGENLKGSWANCPHVLKDEPADGHD